MKTLLMIPALVTILSFGSQALADQQTASIGYAQSKVQRLNNINGVNLKYRYEWGSPVSVIGSFTYLSGSSACSNLLTRDVISNNADIKYYSLSAGPAYRFNKYISIYGLLGLNYNKVDYRSSWTNYESGYYRYMGSETGNISKTSPMYSVGLQINPMENVVLDIGYEGASLDAADQSHNINGFNIGIGYRF